MKDQLDTVRQAAREHEVFTEIRVDEPWMRCQHGKPIMEVWAHWSDDKPGPPVTTGQRNSTQQFTRWVHADGSGPVVDDHGWLIFEHNVVSKCQACGALDTLTTKQEAYGDRTTCSACGRSHYYSIGD